jgi:hypothetical protein
MIRQPELRGSPLPSGSPDATAGGSMNQVVSFGTTPALDALLLPDGRRCSEVSQGELYAVIAKLVPHFSHNWGRNDVLAAYSRHLETIGAAASRAAVAAYLEANK